MTTACGEEDNGLVAAVSYNPAATELTLMHRLAPHLAEEARPRRFVGALSALIAALALLAPGSAQAQGAPQKGIVVLTEFPDVDHSVLRSAVETRFSRHLDNYVREMSYHRVSLQIDVTEKWYTLPRPVSRYRISSRNLEVDRSRVKDLIDNALDLAARDVDFTRYSFAVIFLGARLQDYGMIGLCGYPGMLGWTAGGTLRTGGGQEVKGGVAVFCFQAHLGTLFHDLAHILGGVQGGKRMVPCLYDHDLQAKPGPMRETAVDAMIHLGFWDPMSCHYYKRLEPPPGICSWTKLRLNWIAPAKIKVIRPGEKAEVVLGPLQDGSAETLVVRIPVAAGRYYLVENRQPIGFDRFLPGNGVLIMYADDTVAECRQGKTPVKLINADPSIPHLEGAAFEIGKRDLFRDERNRISIRLTEKVDRSYRLLINAP